MSRSRLVYLHARLRTSRTVLIMLSMLAAIAVVAVAGPLLSPHSFQSTALDLKLASPTLEDARWFTRKELRSGFPKLPFKISIARRMVDDWLERGNG